MNLLLTLDTECRCGAAVEKRMTLDHHVGRPYAAA